MSVLRIYTDTCVIGGCFDDEFKDDSLKFIKLVKRGNLKMLLSEIVIQELNNAPQKVQDVLKLLSEDMIEIVELTQEALVLRDAYLAEGILGQKSANDALHVALATISRADAIVSWNFKHIVRLDKMKAFNQINLLNGYMAS